MQQRTMRKASQESNAVESIAVERNAEENKSSRESANKMGGYILYQFCVDNRI